ncbi:hypothetical protein QQ045_031019 [Rhodiola kirilowii]
MVSVEKGMLIFHRNSHHQQQAEKEIKKVGDVIPKGCLAVKVGQDENEQQRFVVPVMYLNHPLFKQLLKEAEEEYGFDQKGAITIPCHVLEFRYVRGLIDKEVNHHNRHRDHHNHHGLVGCFRVCAAPI